MVGNQSRSSSRRQPWRNRSFNRREIMATYHWYKERIERMEKMIADAKAAREQRKAAREQRKAAREAQRKAAREAQKEAMPEIKIIMIKRIGLPFLHRGNASSDMKKKIKKKIIAGPVTPFLKLPSSGRKSTWVWHA